VQLKVGGSLLQPYVDDWEAKTGIADWGRVPAMTSGPGVRGRGNQRALPQARERIFRISAEIE
jgi:hypothetical protein